MNRLTNLLAAIVLIALLCGPAAALEIVGEVSTGLDANQQWVIRFETDFPSMSRIEYGLDDTYGQVTSTVTALTGRHVHVLSGLDPDTTYHYRIILSDWSGNEVVTGDRTFTTASLGQVTQARGRGADQAATLEWAPVFGAVRYMVERGNDPSGPFAPVGETDQTVFQDTGLTNGSAYYYRVTAVSASGRRSAPSPVVAVTPQPALVDDDFDGPIDSSVWRIYRNSEAGRIDTENGRLVIQNLLAPNPSTTQNRTLGLMLNTPVNLLNATTVVTARYSMASNGEQNLGFFNHGTLSGVQEGQTGFTADDLRAGDVWFYPGFRVTVRPDWLDTTNSEGDGGAFIERAGAAVSAPYTITWEIIHLSGGPRDARFEHRVYIDDRLVHTGSYVPGAFDPTQAYFYVYVSTTYNGRTEFDSVKIEQVLK